MKVAQYSDKPGFSFCNPSRTFSSITNVKKQFGQATKMTKFGNVEMPFDHVNNPQDAAFLGGHELNESYKIPSAHPSGKNASYAHPLGTGRENADTASKMIAPKVLGKNPGRKGGFGPIQ